MSRRMLVTGGSKGIGAAIVAAARHAGDRVVFTGRDQSRIDGVADATGAVGVRADITAAADNARTVERAIEQLGGIDVLVNNPAIGYFAPIGDLDLDSMRAMYETNVFGMVELTNRIVPLMKEQGHGDIVNLSSTSGLSGHVNGTPYASSKFAIRGISQSWQVELRPHDIRVICVCPAEVQTGFDGLDRPTVPDKLFAEDVAHGVMAALDADRRAFWPELVILPTNPWRSGNHEPRRSGLY